MSTRPLTARPDVVVVGAGQAGLATSWYLQLLGIEHIVLERGRVGESWRSARWDSFTLVTPAWMTRLPGLEQRPGTGQEFTGRDDLVALLEAYSQRLPVLTGVDVYSLHRAAEKYQLVTSAGLVTTRAVVAASGSQRLPRIPSLAAQLPGTLLQLHASQYRNPAALPSGGVLVVGSGQSGAQIAEELLQAGRQVFVATSRVSRIPRRYRGRDAHDWGQEMGRYDRPVDQAEPDEIAATNPLLSGARGGHSLALQQLARDGAVLLGRLLDASPTTLRFDDGVAEHIRYGDETAAAFRRAVDLHIRRRGLAVPSSDVDPVEEPLTGLPTSSARLQIATTDVTSVIWCAGFGPDTGWIDLPVLDRRGDYLGSGGVTAVPGFYTLGSPWLTHRGSGILYGVGTDASRVARNVAAHLGCGSRTGRQLPRPEAATSHLLAS